jgi:hypothetical protein
MGEERLSTSSSHSTIGEVAGLEKADALMDQYAEVHGHGRAPRQAIGEEEEEYYTGQEHENLEASGRSLSRLDTAAWVTKHPSRIPDDGNTLPPPSSVSPFNLEYKVDMLMYSHA